MAATNNLYQVFEKPIQHLGLDDWFARINQLCNVADVRRNDAFDVRQSSRCVRNESAVQTHWETVHNNSRLSNRFVKKEKKKTFTFQLCRQFHIRFVFQGVRIESMARRDAHLHGSHCK